MQSTMRGILVSAENARQSTSQLRREKAFDDAGMFSRLQGSGGSYRDSTLYATIPVVAAWKSVEKAAEKEGYQFRVAAHNPRNPKNAPDPKESEILAQLERTGNAEYFELDDARQEIVYARPVVLTQDCMGCHGDPATSASGNGKDAVGFAMEGWKEGQMHGIFLLRGNLHRFDKQVNAATWKGVLWLLGPVIGLLICLPLGLKPIQRLLEGNIRSVGGEAESLERSANLLSHHSTTLARAASEQSASVEESSATMEQIQSMTRRNAENAAQAARGVQESMREMGQVQTSLQSLQGAMEGIQDSSDQIGRITKVMDELAFQTNILALNAAVEAARAGEFGMGFAVVAEEVRNLAQKSSAAAKEIQAVVENSCSNTRAGETAVEQVAESMRSFGVKSSSLEKSVLSVEAACQEQARGVVELNQAIALISNITQHLAANADSTAQESAQLKAQTVSLRATSQNLQSLLG